MTQDETIILINTYLPQGFTALSGSAWDVGAYPKVEKSLTANTALTLSGAVAGKTVGWLLLKANGFTLTINGTSIPVSASGYTNITVVASMSGDIAVSSDATPATVTGAAYDLDIVTALGGWGLHRLRSGSGPSVKVRRSSDNTTLDIGVLSNGTWDVSTFLSFIGGGTGYVDTLYDQSAAGKNATQATLAAQPQIVANVFNGLPAIKFDGVDDCLNVVGSQSSYIPVHQTGGTVNAVFSYGLVADPNSLGVVCGNNAVTSTKTGFYLGYDDRASVPFNNGVRGLVAGGSGSASSSVSDAVQNVLTPQTPVIVTWLTDPANATLAARSEFYINQGSLQAQSNANFPAPVGSAATHDLQIGASGASSFFFAGYIAQLVIVGSKINSSSRGSLTANQSAYYNIL